MNYNLKGDLLYENIFVEGIQGSGKSTLINNIVKFNPELHVCREGDYSPIELAWCALMSKKEYEAVLEKYNSIRDEIIKIQLGNKRIISLLTLR